MPEKPIIRVDWYADNWLGGVVLLTALERGVYDTIINLIYQTNGPLEDDDKAMAHACKAGKADYKRAKSRLLELGKIEVVDGLIHQSKCTKELARAGARITAYKEREDRKIQKKREKNEKKTGKKTEKTGQEIQEKQGNHVPSIIGTNSQQAVSLPLTGGEANKPVLREKENSVPGASDNAPSPERGGALSSAASKALKEIRRGVTLAGKTGNADMDEIKRAVQGFDGKCFELGTVNVSPLAWRAICAEAETQGYRFAGGPRIVGEQAA